MSAFQVLINNAGFGMVGAVEEASAAEVKKIYETNVFGVLNVTRAVLPFLCASSAQDISSIGGYRASVGFGVYCLTKFAIEGLTRLLIRKLSTGEH